jgi:membrane AbrB-like protein
LAAATALTAELLDVAGLPSPSLFAALLVGLVAALRVRTLPQVPLGVFRAAQAVTGVSLGVYVQSSSLDAVASAWLPVALVSAATLGLSLLCGTVLARTTEVDPPTAALGMVAGGASGIVGMARELGADDRLVAVMQYLRVLVVVVLTPILVAVAFPDAHGAHAAAATPASTPVIGSLRDWALTAAAVGLGAIVAVASRIPAGSLLGPMIVAAILALTVGEGFQVPAILREPAFAAIGLQVGLRFTPGGPPAHSLAALHRWAARGVLRPGAPAARHQRRKPARRLPGDHARRALRRAGSSLRDRRRHNLRNSRPDAAAVCDGVAGAGRS